MYGTTDYMSFSADSMNNMTSLNVHQRTPSKCTTGGAGDFRCVIRNTFLEVLDDNSASCDYGSRKRSSSDSPLSLKMHVPTALPKKFTQCPDEFTAEEKFSDELTAEEKFYQEAPTMDTMKNAPSNSTLSFEDVASLYSSTPRSSCSLKEEEASSRSCSETPEQSGTPVSPNSPVTPVSKCWADEDDEDNEDDDASIEGPQYSTEILQALEELTQLVEVQQYKREDLQQHKAIPMLYPHIPLDEEGVITSLGSMLHFDGTCKPCAFLKKDRCHKKDLCLYCHFAHDFSAPKPIRFRMSKKKRMRQARQRCVVRENSEYFIGAQVSL